MLCSSKAGFGWWEHSLLKHTILFSLQQQYRVARTVTSVLKILLCHLGTWNIVRTQLMLLSMSTVGTCMSVSFCRREDCVQIRIV